MLIISESLINSFFLQYFTNKSMALDECICNHVKMMTCIFRFLPMGSYINAQALGPEKLALKMNDIIYDKNKYYDYFKWHRYYSIHNYTHSPDSDGICGLCAFLNNRKLQYTRNIYARITWFWIS